MGRFPNFIDRTVAYFSPKDGLKRQKARALLDIRARAYEAASLGRRTEGWRAPTTSANAETSRAIGTLRSRSRDLVRNNPYAARAVALIESGVVGTGIRPQAVHDAEQVRAEVEDLWREWAHSTACDADGIHDFYGLQAMAMRSIAESGEVLIRARWRRAEDDLPVPLQLQVLEADHLDDFKDGVEPNGEVRRQGIEFDRLGRRKGYWLFRDHPGDSIGFRNFESVFVRADTMLHLYRVDRPGQCRGIPWGAPAMLRIRSLDEYEDAQVVRQRIAACFGAFIYNMEGESAEEGDELDWLEPGAIMRLGPGEQVQLAQPPPLTGYAEFNSAVLHSVAVAYGLTYESLAGDLKGVNFSSGRMGHLVEQRNLKAWQRGLVIERFCNPVWAWFMEAAVLAGRLREPVRATWTPPRREMIDPGKEIQAQLVAVQAGFQSLSSVIREAGMDPEETLAELARDQALAEQLGLKLTAFQGSAAPEPPMGDEGDDEDPDEEEEETDEEE